MSKSRVRRGFRNPVYIILCLSFLLALGFVSYRALLSPAPIEIFAINPVSLQYGNTTVSGTIHKDAPAGQPGTFLLVLADSRAVLLDVQGLDNLLGLSVSISGTLSPAAKPGAPLTMIVKEITVSK